MGLSPYSTPADGGVLCVILFNTAMSLSIVKDMLCSMLLKVGINIPSWDDYYMDDRVDPLEYRGTPSENYMKEFRNRLPCVRYDTVIQCCDFSHECPVCLTEFESDAEINHLTCGHVFHRLCLEKWLKYWHTTCPLCRNYILPVPAEEEEINLCPM